MRIPRVQFRRDVLMASVVFLGFSLALLKQPYEPQIFELYLTLAVAGIGGTLTGLLAWLTDRSRGSEARESAGCYRTTLTGIVIHPGGGSTRSERSI
jgi:hypothetical protein